MTSISLSREAADLVPKDTRCQMVFELVDLPIRAAPSLQWNKKLWKFGTKQRIAQPILVRFL
jgi:hypothetical protein